jgi:23S rRNA-/tRNA-specific pseudouridylate synthase
MIQNENSRMQCSACLKSFESRNKLFRHISQCNKPTSFSVSDLRDGIDVSKQRDYGVDGAGDAGEDDEGEGEGEEDEEVRSLSDFIVPTLLRVVAGKSGSGAQPVSSKFSYRIVCKPQGISTRGGSKGCHLGAHNGLAYAFSIHSSTGAVVTRPVPLSSTGAHALEIWPEASDSRAESANAKPAATAATAATAAEQGHVSKVFSVKHAVPVHRLDLPTGGLVLCSEDRATEVHLRRLFFRHAVQKRYRALVHGRLRRPTDSIPDLQTERTEAARSPVDITAKNSDGSGSFASPATAPDDIFFIKEPVDGKKCVTAYRIVCITPSARHGWITTVDLFPITGRRHQLRKHLKSLGCPIVGDKRYGHQHMWPLDRSRYPYLFLWALQMRFPDPNFSADANADVNVAERNVAAPANPNPHALSGDSDDLADGSIPRLWWQQQPLSSEQATGVLLMQRLTQRPFDCASASGNTSYVAVSDGVVDVCLAEPKEYAAYRQSEAEEAARARNEDSLVREGGMK